MATINLGRVGFVNKGTYSGATAYKVNDVVVYNNGVYACISPTTGNLPTNTTYWKLWLAPSTLVAKTGDTMTGTLTTPSLVSTGELYSNDGTTITRVISSGGVSYIGTITNHPIVLQTNNTERMIIDTAGNVLVTSSGGGLGYGTGAGGTVTQLTSKSTSVTLNKPCGQITMHNENLAAGASVRFDCYNSNISMNDAVLVTCNSSVRYNFDTYVYPGLFGVHVKNITTVAFAEEIIINFSIIKGATA